MVRVDDPTASSRSSVRDRQPPFYQPANSDRLIQGNEMDSDTLISWLGLATASLSGASLIFGVGVILFW